MANTYFESRTSVLICRKVLGVALLCLVCCAPVFAISEGKPAPALEATLLDGRSFALASQAGKVVIINFWATWCAPCRAEMPALDAYYRQHRDEGLVMIAISMDDSKDESKVREVMRGFAFPAAMGRDSNFKGYARIWRLPLTFVVDRSGVLLKQDWYGDPGIDVPLLEQTVSPWLHAR